MKKVLTFLLTLILFLSLTQITSCGRHDTSRAVHYMQVGDAYVEMAGGQISVLDSTIYYVFKVYSSLVAGREIEPHYDLKSIEYSKACLLDLIKQARKEYEEILSLRGVNDYQSYAREMMKFLDALSALMSTYEEMYTRTDAVIKDLSSGKEPPDIADDLNSQREEALKLKRSASEHYDDAYVIAKDKINAGWCPTESKPMHVHLSWQHDPQKTMTVHWESDKWLRNYHPTVEYGLNQDNLDKSAEGRSYLFYSADVEQYDVEITKLKPGSKYYYRCGSPRYGWSDTLSFETPPAGDENFTFCVLGDTRSKSIASADVEEWGKVAQAAGTENPLFTLHGGDYVYRGSANWMWPNWFESGTPLLEEGAMMCCHGGHEGYAMGYFDRFTLPGNERWYSFDVSNIHFVFLDTGLFNWVGRPLLQEQSPWLKNDLSTAREGGADWIIVFMHRPAYATGKHGNQNDIIEEWVPIFDEYGVDLVLEAHQHYYERSFPMTAGHVRSTTPDQYRKGDGIIYMIQGCGGAPLHDFKSAEWVASSFKDYSYTMVDVQPGKESKISFETKTVDGRTLDSFSIVK